VKLDSNHLRVVSDSGQSPEFFDALQWEDRYHRTALDDMRLGDVNTDQLAHYLACRRELEEHLDEESVFEELVRLARQADEETNDKFVRITTKALAENLAVEATVTNVPKERLASIAFGMLCDGWTEDEVRYALGTLTGT